MISSFNDIVWLVSMSSLLVFGSFDDSSREYYFDHSIHHSITFLFFGSFFFFFFSKFYYFELALDFNKVGRFWIWLFLRQCIFLRGFFFPFKRSDTLQNDFVWKLNIYRVIKLQDKSFSRGTKQTHLLVYPKRLDLSNWLVAMSYIISAFIKKHTQRH